MSSWLKDTQGVGKRVQYASGEDFGTILKIDDRRENNALVQWDDDTVVTWESEDDLTYIEIDDAVSTSDSAIEADAIGRLGDEPVD